MSSISSSKLIAINRFLNIDFECDQLCANLKGSNYEEIERDVIKIDSGNRHEKYEYFPVQVFSYRVF